MKISFVPKIALSIFLLSLLGCASLTGGGSPKWVTNPKAVYSEKKYLVAVGEGDTRHAAENAASANLARIFESHIHSDERLTDQTRETKNDFERTTDFTSDINILSDQTLYNIQHAEAWQAPMGRVHAVAYLNRLGTAHIYRNKINEKTARIHFLLNQAEQTNHLLEKYALLRATARQTTENNQLLQQLKIIHPPSASAPDYSENDIRKALADTASQIHVQINIKDDNKNRITTVIEELITRYGFRIATPSTLKVNGRISVTDAQQQTSGLVFVRYSLVLQVKDSEGSVLLSMSEKGREGHISLYEARIRSFRTMETAIKSSGSQRLDAYLDALIDQSAR